MYLSGQTVHFYIDVLKAFLGTNSRELGHQKIAYSENFKFCILISFNLFIYVWKFFSKKSKDIIFPIILRRDNLYILI